MLAIFSFFSQSLHAQNVAINSDGSSPNASAALDLQSSNKGLLIPQISLSSMTDGTTITSPATSLLIYNTNTSTSTTRGVGYYYNAGTSVAPSWTKLVVTNDTVVKSITPNGDVIKLERFPMGEMSMTGNTTVTNISSANGWVKAAGTTTLSAGAYKFTTGGVSNRLKYTGTSMKMFHIACTISVKAFQDGSNLKAVIYKNGVALTAGIVQTKMLSNSDIVSTAIHVMTDMSTNDYLELYITNTVGSDDFTVTEMNMFAMGISMGMD
jgi:hypothetical protein